MDSSHSTKEHGDIPIPVTESKSSKSTKAAPSPVVKKATKKVAKLALASRWKRCLGIFDFIIRICAIAGALAAATAMGTTSQQLPFFTQFFKFEADFSDLPAFT